MTSAEIRQRFLKFFEKRGHAIVPSASLIPVNDPSSLFITAGMQPMVPYLLGQKHPAGKRLVDSQKCVRTVDIDEVGDNRHLTFFEMLGNWSLGDYTKEESIPWSFEFLTNKEEGLGLDPKRLYITVFKGEEKIPKDEKSIEIWQKVFKENNLSAGVAENETISPGVRIIPLGADDNFWIAGATGPCGPDTEMFYDTEPEKGELSGKFSELVDNYRLIEVWNNVFMEFNKTESGEYLSLSQKSVDTGMGLERTTAVVNGKQTVFDTDLFVPILNKIEEFTVNSSVKGARILADHVKAVVFLIADGITPSNTDRGYVLRRLLRRAVLQADKLGMKHGALFWLAETVIEMYKNVYPEVKKSKDTIKKEIDGEEQKFRKILTENVSKMIHKFETMNQNGESLTGDWAFFEISSRGIPKDVILELASESKVVVSPNFEKELEDMFKKHQDLSRTGAEKKFKGGLADTSEMSVKYHTATHLLNAALRQILGKEVMQKGSNITPERLRFDFAFPRKMTDEEKKQVEDLVNQKIKEDLPVSFTEMPKAEAEKTGAVHAFGEKYGDVVKVYSIGDEKSGFFSREFCGGPHAEGTGVLGHFKIAKEEAVSAGVRRIKAVLE